MHLPPISQSLNRVGSNPLGPFISFGSIRAAPPLFRNRRFFSSSSSSFVGVEESFWLNFRVGGTRASDNRRKFSSVSLLSDSRNAVSGRSFLFVAFVSVSSSSSSPRLFFFEFIFVVVVVVVAAALKKAPRRVVVGEKRSSDASVAPTTALVVVVRTDEEKKTRFIIFVRFFLLKFEKSSIFSPKSHAKKFKERKVSVSSSISSSSSPSGRRERTTTAQQPTNQP